MGKTIESGGGRKNAQGLMITIRIVNFSLISCYGTYVKVLNPLNSWVGSIAYRKFSYSCDTLNVSQFDFTSG